MAKRTIVNRTMRQARSVMKNYVRPGAKSASKTAEDTLQEVLHLMGEARDRLARMRARGRVQRKKPRAASKRRKAAFAGKVGRVKRGRKARKAAPRRKPSRRGRR